MARKNRSLNQFVLGTEPMKHKMGSLSEGGSEYFFNVKLKDGNRLNGERFKAEEVNADFYFKNGNSSLAIRNVICYYHGSPNDSFPVLITDKQFKPLYVEKGYVGKIKGLDVTKNI